MTDKAVGRKALAELLGDARGRGGMIGTFHHVGGKGPGDDHREWAVLLKVREELGECLTPAQAEAWRAALGTR
jgi:hypothetical protein